jgi:hypothetical protein
VMETGDGLQAQRERSGVQLPASWAELYQAMRGAGRTVVVWLPTPKSEVYWFEIVAGSAMSSVSSIVGANRHSLSPLLPLDCHVSGHSRLFCVF